MTVGCCHMTVGCCHTVLCLYRVTRVRSGGPQKTAAFQFGATYIYPLYVAFWKPYAVQHKVSIPRLGLEAEDWRCIHDDCMVELEYTLLILFISMIAAQNLAEFLLPRMLKWFNRFKASCTKTASESASGGSELDTWEKEATLAPYDEEAQFNDFAEMVVQ
eukprot:SAG11_NODE_3643_length_2316_cov_2.335589_1_plen_161_part_00